MKAILDKMNERILNFLSISTGAGTTYISLEAFMSKTVGYIQYLGILLGALLSLVLIIYYLQKIFSHDTTSKNTTR